MELVIVLIVALVVLVGAAAALVAVRRRREGVELEPPSRGRLSERISQMLGRGN